MGRTWKLDRYVLNNRIGEWGDGMQYVVYYMIGYDWLELYD